ncbi:hypothetical protein FHR81_005614 [Actinoalloteichus hoggarensis]|uniref:Uncharacterized protein n=1 Tax=Actinoalloteichus hoggarensis TaxID=1470176 RepID=A0A221W8C6_9PSEU|nr:hypothetical protein [Actinoalloteichus hoggarensis]ASO21921.1 hypothetical protein AHOG_21525 [Actinoalloteichus hoggarensis]MBB5924529.1 hypothetical protein [Actinoalloteichus hoggarensis]
MTARRPAAAERAALRAFVREHHPDLGGDPDRFAAGLRDLQEARRRAELGLDRPGRHRADAAGGPSRRADRFDGPIVGRRPDTAVRRLLHRLRRWASRRRRPARFR